MKKNIYLLLFLLIFVFSFFVNKQTIVAAGETITLERIGAEKNSQTNKWDWRFSITTTGGVENSDIWMKIYTGNVTADGSNLYHQETAGKLKDNKAEINTDFILEDNQIYSISFTINMKPVLHAVYKNTTGDTQSQGDVINFTPQTNTTTNKSDVYTLLAPIGEFRVAPDNIGEYFNVIFLIAIGLCGVLAVIMIVIGGIQYMGDESVFGKTQAKERITKAILGLIIALGAFALLNTINPELLGGGGLNIKQVTAEIEGDTDAPVTMGSSGTIEPSSVGITCNKTGGFPVLTNVAKSFNGKMTYQMGAKGTKGPGGTIKYDCSGFVNAALQCAGINKNSVNGGTWTIFSGTKAEKVSSPNSITNTSINNIALQVGDLVGWKAENGEEFGHVMIYIGGGLLADSHGGKEGRKQGGAYGQFSVEKYKNRIKYVVRTSKL